MFFVFETDPVIIAVFFSKFAAVMFENLSERLERSFKILKGEGKITEINIAETLKEVRRALLDADVSYKVAKDFCDRVKQKALGANVLTAVNPRQQMIKIMLLLVKKLLLFIKRFH